MIDLHQHNSRLNSKHRIEMPLIKYILTLLITTLFFSCNSTAEKSNEGDKQAQNITPTQQAQAQAPGKNIKSQITENKNETSSNIMPAQQAIMEFVDYNDDGDYFILNANKNSKIYSFINENDDRTLVRGDLIDVTWKETTIQIPGDSSDQKADKIINITKVKDGKTSNFRKEYQKELKYTWSQEENYSEDYLNKLYKVVEYYIANSDNELLQQHVKNKDQLSYSIEKQNKDDKEYTMIGISTTNSENHQNTVQWLYLDDNQNILYDYDLPNDKLIEVH